MNTEKANPVRDEKNPQPDKLTTPAPAGSSEKVTTPESELPVDEKRKLLDSKTSDLNVVKPATTGRVVNFFANGGDEFKDDKLPAMVTQASTDHLHLNLNVFTNNGNRPNVLREQVLHKSELEEFGGTIKHPDEGGKLPYWDWPVIK